MKIGFVNIYSFRPHVEHAFFLSTLIKSAGHETFFLACDASVDNCYARAIKGSTKLKECPKCILGGLRSFPVSQVESISKKVKQLNLANADKEMIATSSSFSLNRIETEEEWFEEEVVSTRESFYSSIEQVYSSAISWIERNKLDAVICFNGRIELTRAITFACEKKGIPFVIHERTWFGNGLRLIPNENTLSIKVLQEMIENYKEKFLTKSQALYAGKLIAERFAQKNHLEWRVYNKEPETMSWPLQSSGKKVLILPSSKGENAGHKERLVAWKDNTSALEDFFLAFGIKRDQVVIRFHPNWAENIGRTIGSRPRNHYTNWATKNNIFFIDSNEKANTYDLIKQADIVVMNGGSSAVEAGALGKQVICLGPAPYDNAGFVRTFKNKESLYKTDSKKDLDPIEVVRKTLRYVYLQAARFPQFVDYVRASTTTNYSYYKGASSDRLISLIQTGKLEPDDKNYSEDISDEDVVIEHLKNQDWSWFLSFESNPLKLESLEIKRKFGFRWIDKLRNKLPRGDR